MQAYCSVSISPRERWSRTSSSFISGSWLGLVGASQEETTAVRGISTPNILQTEETTDDP
jgi:hypothetical protein